ncbi:MAG: flagellar biosynthetic protein FliO [Burkholderiaceae bacterium]
MTSGFAARHFVAALCIALPLAAAAQDAGPQSAPSMPSVLPAAPAAAATEPSSVAAVSAMRSEPAAPAGRPSAAIGAARAGDGPASVGKTLSGLVLVLGLIAGAAWLMKRTGMAKPGGGSIAKVVGGVSVGNRERVVVVEVGDQWIVVGVAPGRVNALAQLPRGERADPAIATLPAAGNFSAWLKQTIERRQPPGAA